MWANLPVARIEDLIGNWRGTGFETGHSGTAALKDLRWYGKRIRAQFDVDPVVCEAETGELTVNTTAAGGGGASLWMVGFRDEVTATMVYDSLPIFDHFKIVDDNFLLGIMNGKGTIEDSGHFYFSLERD
ncbi:GXWXG protein [Lentzea flava]|nr:GXWXG protein [Lentzea flava]